MYLKYTREIMINLFEIGLGKYVCLTNNISLTCK
jgi:hypothetical protein